MKHSLLTYLLAGTSMVITGSMLATATWAGSAETEVNDPLLTQEAPFISALNADIVLPKGVTLSPKDKAIMKKITPEQFELLINGEDPARIETIEGRTVDESIAAAKLGDNNEELVFTPINPCRVIDTGVAGGKFTANETRSYTLSGKSDFSEFGGSNGTCTLPGSEGVFISSRIVRAWALNITAAAPDGGGNFQVWPANQSPSTSSAVNFQKLVPNLNNANALIIANCDDTGSFLLSENPLCPQGDISFKANFSGVRLVVDVLGYFTRADVSQVKATAAEATQTEDIDLADKVCHNLTSCGRTVFLGSPSPAGKLVVMGSANFDVTTGSGSVNRFLTLSDTDGSTCNNPTNDPHAARLETQQETGSLIDKQLNVQGVFPVEASVTKTIFLNARVSGDTTNAHINSSSIICTFIPN